MSPSVAEIFSASPVFCAAAKTLSLLACVGPMTRSPEASRVSYRHFERRSTSSSMTEGGVYSSPGIGYSMKNRDVSMTALIKGFRMLHGKLL